MKEYQIMENFLKEKGINEYWFTKLMKIIKLYINEETITNEYSQEEINQIMFDFGNALNDLMFCNFMEMGLQEEDYSEIGITIILSVERCYKV